MQPLHGLLGSLVMVAAALFAVGGGIAVWLDRGHAWVRRGAILLIAMLLVQVLVGAIVYASGTRPREGLHLLYGVAILGVLPLAFSFASEAPPRPRSGVMAIGGAITLLLAWRLLSTG